MRKTEHRGIFCTGFLALTVAVALLVTMSGCVGVNIRSGEVGLRTIVTGSGDVVTKDFDVADFDKIRIDGDYTLVYTEAAECGVSIEMQESLFEHVEVTSKDGKLEVYSQDYLRNSGSFGDLRVYVSAPTLAEMNLAGNISVEGSSPIAGETFGLRLSGAGEVTLELAIDEIQAFVAGTGSLNLSGTATYASMDLSGSGSLDALDLSTMNAKISISGAGNGSITCSNNLDVDISGAGTVEYRGDAAVTQNISGFGSVEKVD